MSRWKVYAETDYYFCTTTITNWYAIFTESIFFDVIIKSLNFCRNHKGLKIHAYVIMLNHLHLIISSGSNNSLSYIMRDFKRHTSKEMRALLKSKQREEALRLFKEEARNIGKNQNYKIWQDGFHPIGLESEYFFLQKLNYIHENPVRKGYVVKPEYWYYSSASNYAGYTSNAMSVDEW